MHRIDGVCSATKFAVHALTTALRRELRQDGVDVLEVASSGQEV